MTTVKIIDTIPDFMESYTHDISHLQAYYAKYPDIFKEYFMYHCKNTEQRYLQSLKKYPQQFVAILEIQNKLPALIQEIEEQYLALYQLSFPIDVNLIVGGYGSNAYTYREIIPNISFALERMSPDTEHVQVLAAHEFGHAAQNILSDQTGTDWSMVDWNSPLTWLNQEGAATHFSRRIVPGLSPAIYFSYDGEGEQWLAFAQEHKEAIKQAFAQDYRSMDTMRLFKEWFSINGGSRFGHNRLAYFLADQFFRNQIERLGEEQAIIAWGDSDFKPSVENWLQEKIIS